MPAHYRGRRRPPRRTAYLKSLLPILLIFLAFALALTSYAFLGRIRSPVAAHHLGWQAWEPIELASHKDNSSDGSGSIASLRLDTWNPMAAHTTGLTEIAVQKCLISPYIFAAQCAPPTTPEDDGAKGKWVMVSPNLNVKTGYTYLNVWYRRTRRLDAELITHIKTVPDPPPDDEELTGWIRAAGNLHAGTWGQSGKLGLWYKLSPPHVIERRDDDDNDSDNDGKKIITELSVQYGGHAPFFGFERVPGPKVAGGKDVVELMFRRGNPQSPKAGRLRFHQDGTFKIMQIADLHYSVGQGACRDTDRQCGGDADTAEWLAEALDAEKPDLVVFSGDQLNGQKTSYDARSVLAKFAEPVIERKIPWAAVFGNHDSEIAADRDEQMWALMQMPYSLARTGPADVDGVGNYDLRVYSPDPSRTHIFTLYFLDSHSYRRTVSPISWFKPDYDYIKPSQIEWYLSVSSSVKPIQRPFQPDGGKDLGHIWARGRGPRRLDEREDEREEKERTLAKPNAMMFFHIPLPEAYDPGDRSPNRDDEMYTDGILDLGSQRDGSGAATTNSHLFSNGIQAALEVAADDADAAGLPRVPEVKVLSHGHCHNTDRCRRVSGVWMCFDGGSSFSGYGAADFDRRVRVYNVSQWGETIASYKRLTSGDIIDRQVLVGEGAPAPFWAQ